MSVLAGRRFHMLGIGGAGVSALAQLCAAWGAEVDGCDPSASAYLDIVCARGIDAVIGHDPAHIQPGVEVVRSSAVPADHPEIVRARELGCDVRLRGELLAELTRLRTTVVVAGAHGKSTTTGMLAHVCMRCDLDPALALGALLPGAGDELGGGNVLVGAGPFLVEGDESDRTLLGLGASIAVVTNIERDHHHTFSSDEEVEQLFAEWVESLGPDSVLIAGPGDALDRLVAGARGRVVRFGTDDAELERVARALSVPGRHNALNALAAIAAAAELGVDPVIALAELGDFGGIGRRWQQIGVADGVAVVDDYAHHPTEVAATIEAAGTARSARGGHGRILVVFQPHLYSRTEALWREFAAALATADGVWVLPIYGAREQPVPGITSDLITEELARLAPDTLLGTPAIVDPVTGDLAGILDVVERGDIVITMGAGDVTKLAPRLVEEIGTSTGAHEAAAPGAHTRPACIEQRVPLHRFTTIGTGGEARWFAKVEREAELGEVLAWAHAEALPFAVVGLGSNTLIDDAGFDGVAIRLAGDLAAIDIDASTSTVRLGGGASLAAAVRLCRDAGLAGFEFACAIPGTAGGALKMNAGAYGGEMVDVLARAVLIGHDGRREVGPDDLDLRYRSSSIGWNEVVAEIVLSLSPGDPEQIKATVREMQSRRSDTQPRAARSFGSVFQNPTVAPAGSVDGRVLGAGALVEAAGLKGFEIGGARISPKHGNFIENTGDATTADILQLIERARTAVRDFAGIELHTEVHLLGRDGYRPLYSIEVTS